MSNPAWWPYRAPPKQVFRISAAIVAGLFTGSYAVTKYFQPLAGYDEELQRGKTALLLKYKKRFDERKSELQSGGTPKGN